MDTHETFKRIWRITPDGPFNPEMMLKSLFDDPDAEHHDETVQFLRPAALVNHIGVAEIKNGTIYVINVETDNGQFLRSMPAAAFNTLIASRVYLSSLIVKRTKSGVRTFELAIGTGEGTHVIELTESVHSALSKLALHGSPIVKRCYHHQFSGRDGQELICAIGELTTYANQAEFTLSIEFVLQEQAEAFELPEPWDAEEIIDGPNYDHQLATRSMVDA